MLELLNQKILTVIAISCVLLVVLISNIPMTNINLKSAIYVLLAITLIGTGAISIVKKSTMLRK